MICIDTVPATPMTDVCAVYDIRNEALQIIESSWNKVVGYVCRKWFTPCGMVTPNYRVFLPKALRRLLT